MAKITKAVILAAGYGTRFLPVTKAMPKEMLPVVDKPVIQYAVEDAVAAGIKDIVIVTSSQKRAIEDHFDNSFELETVLEAGGKTEQLNQVRGLAELANFIYVRQKGTRKGNLVGIQAGYEAIGNEPFIVLWGDDFFVSRPTRCQQLVTAYEKYQAPILGAFETTDPAHTKLYGYAAGETVEAGILKVDKIIEKPGPDAVPSTYATVSGFVFTPEFMEYASKVEPNPRNGEYGYTDAVELLLHANKPVYAVKIQDGKYYDCGNKLDYIKTNIELALQNPEMGQALQSYINTLHKEKEAPAPAEVAVVEAS